MDDKEILAYLQTQANPENVAGMARFGITGQHVLGVPKPVLRQLAKDIGKNRHDLALKLWDSGVLEARVLASLIDAPAQVTDAQMERWVSDFDSWDVCDQCCLNLFRKTALAYPKALAWSRREEEFVKRAGFVLMATLAVHDKKAPDEQMLRFLPVITAGATDERNFVKKAVNWALRQIGKRNLALNRQAIATAQSLAEADSRSARWVGRDALRELTDPKVQARLQK
ncbi:MAG: DNA alkylation repair protein [Anaerolineae bacterium]